MSSNKLQCPRCQAWFLQNQLKAHMDNCVTLRVSIKAPDGWELSIGYEGPSSTANQLVGGLQGIANNTNKQLTYK